MEKLTYLDNANGAFIEDLYRKYRNDPESVGSGWRKFFEGYELGAESATAENGQPDTGSDLDYVGESGSGNKEVNVSKLIFAYRERGHLIADTNPVRPRRVWNTSLNLEYFNLGEADLDTEFEVGREIGLGKATLRKILAHLKKTYCGAVGVEFRQIRNSDIRQWLYKHMEPIANSPDFDKDQKKRILKKINEAVMFESFLHTKFVGQKRFSLEGIEALIPAMDAVIETGAHLDAKEFVIGMAHRGRLNMLVNIFGKSYENIFSEFAGSTLPNEVFGDGDVKYHLGRSADIVTDSGKKVHLSLLPNPSHLEAVNPVLLGVARAKARKMYNKDFKNLVPIVIHGDAAISGQGVVYECANFATLNGYETGGTIHIVLNNQVGFTANYLETRSSIYCTDIAKMLEAPVFHVNADDPEAVTHVMQLAIKMRQKFGCDVFIDILGYRRYGHNEGDEPTFTQPLLYERIKKHKNVFEIYLQRLIEEGTIAKEYADQIRSTLKEVLQKKLEKTKEHKRKIEVNYLGRQWSGLRIAEAKDFEKSVKTGVKKSDLDKIARSLITVPENFNLYAKMKKLLNHREDLYFNQKKIDWAMGELLAYGSLVMNGHHVRLSGQDSQRGTFSHRHSIIRDVKTEAEYVPLNHIQDEQATFTAYNSHLSEYGVLGFEFGYSMATPNDLTLWEAQFGDFANGAQIVFDQFISSSESKWQRMSGLTVLLPHGFEGQGPEHSSARLERYLQLCGQLNMYVINPTSPANFFHMLRRQVVNPFRKPAIVMTPKSGLRHPLMMSDISELTKGEFKEIIDDYTIEDKTKVKTVVLVSGKFFFDLYEHREEIQRKDIALVRVEQLYPLAGKQLNALKKSYPNAKKWIWAQEEPENMGAWAFINRKLPEFNFVAVARPESSSPATGSSIRHDEMQLQLINTIINA